MDDNMQKYSILDHVYYRMACGLQAAWDFAAGNKRLYDRGLEPHMPDQSLAYSGIATALFVFASRDINAGFMAGGLIMIADLLENGQIASRDKAYAYDQEQARKFQPR